MDAVMEIGTVSSRGQIAIPSEIRKRLRIKEGEKVAIIGYEIPHLPYWPRLAHLKITAEITARDTKEFWEKDDLTKVRIIEIFKSTGAKVVVAKTIPECCSKTNWHKVNNTNVYYYVL